MIRTVCRWFIRCIAVLCILVVAAGTAFYFFFPKTALKEYLLTTLGTVFDRRIELGTIHVNPFRGIVIRDLAMHDTESFGAGEFITIGELVLKYRLMPLLDRKITVDEVAITRPSVTFSRTRDGAMNVDDLLRMVAPADSAAPDTAAADTGAFAFSFDIRTFSIRDIRAALDGPYKISLGGLSLEVHRAIIRPPDTYRGTVRITAGQDGSPNLIFIQNEAPALPEKILARLAMDLTVTMNGLDSVSCRGPVILHALETVLHGRQLPSVAAGIRLDAGADLLRGRFRLDESSLLFQQEDAVSLTAVIHDLYTAPSGSVSVTGGAFPLSRVSSLLPRFIPGISAGGRLSLDGTRLTFSADSSFGSLRAAAATSVRLSGFHFDDARSGITIRSGDISFSGQHNLHLAGSVPSLRSGGTITVADGRADLDSVSVPFGGMSLDYSAATEGSLLPRKASVTAALTDIFTGSVSLDIAARSSGNLLDDIRLQALVSAENIDLAAIPLVPVRGLCSAAVSVAGSSWTDIGIAVTADLEGLSYPLEDAWETCPSFRFETGMRLAAVPPSFSEITVHDIKGSVGDLLRFGADAGIRDFGTGGITLSLTGARLDLSRLISWAPASLLASVPVLDDMALTGTVSTTAEIRTALPASDSSVFAYDARATMELRDITCRLPAMGLACEGLEGTAAISADPFRIVPEMDIIMDRASVAPVRAAPFRGVYARLKASLEDFNDAVLHELTAGITEAGTEITARGTVHGLSERGYADLTAGLSVTNSEPYEALPGIAVTGDMAGSVRITLPDINRMRGSVQGKLKFNGMNVMLEQDIWIRDINGGLALDHSVDLDSMHILPVRSQPSGEEDENPAAYGAYGDLLRRDLPGLSTITVGRVEYGRYYLGRIRADMLVRNTIVDIKEFRIDELYGGNLAGNLRLDLGDGRLDDITRQLRYRFYAQLAEASADSLIRSIPALRTIRSGSHMSKGDRTRVCADFSLEGTGLDFAGNPNLEGSVNFTKIGPQVTNRLLDLLDPEQKDRGFNSVRLLINNGWRPNYFGADIRHNNVYAVIKLDESRGAKLARYATLGLNRNIKQPIEFARKPLAALISTLGLEEMLRF